MSVIAGKAREGGRATSEFARLDGAHLLHPSTRMDLHSAENVVIFERARGVRMWDVEGREWLDALSGLLNVSLGYGRPEITAAVKESLDDLSYATMFHGRGHTQAAQLAEVLVKVTPDGIDHFLLTVSGSDAIDSALKFVRFANAMQGRPEKHHVIGRLSSYHGMTFGGTSASGQAANWDGYGPLVPGFSHINQPTEDRPDASEELEQRILELGPENVAAFIAEPVSLPSGIVVPPRGYWPRIREICSKYEVLLIADEVICGFGRTGEWFGLGHWGVVPDLLVMSKAINNGAIPMGVLGMTQEVFKHIAAPGRTLLHGFTGGGHPAACAAALATLKIFEDENVVARGRELGEHLGSELTAMAARSEHIGAVRNLGMLAAFELKGVSEAEPGAATAQFLAKLHDLQVMVRAYPRIDTIVIGSPLTATKDEVTETVARLEEAAASIDA